MAFTGFNFRSTLGYVTDTQPSGYGAVCAFVGAGAYSGGAGFGYLSSSPTVANRSTSIDARLAGDHTMTTMLFQMRVDMPSGNYKFRFAAGATGVMAPQEALIWDGGCVDGATTITNGNHTNYAASTAFALNRYTIFGTNLYKATTGGTTGAASAPTHISGTASDGTVVWTFIKSAIARCVNASVTSGSQMDATNAIHTNANWPANNAQSAQVTVTSGFVTITRGQTSNLTLRHFAFDPQATPLQPLAIFDEFGASLGASFTLYASQPAGYQVVRITALAGAAAYTLGGTLATYFTIATIDEVQWIVQSTRIPDAVTSGTLTITQTDASPLISGSPFLNSYTVTVTSSGGRSTNESTVEGLLSTQASLIVASVNNAHSGIWQGVTRSEVPSGNVFQVSSSAEFVAAWNAITPDGTSTYCIELLNGSYESNVSLNSKNFGTGGLLVTPAAGNDPEFNQISTNNNIVVKGLHFDGVKQSMAPAGGAFFAWRFGPYNGTYANRLKFSNCRVGYMYKAGATEAQISDLAAPGVGNSTAWVSVDHAEQLIITDNIGDGTSQMIGCSGARILHVKGNRNMRGTDDHMALAIQKATVDALGVFADDNLYWLIEDEVYDREIDYSGFTTTAHRDFIQLRPTLDGSPYGEQRTVAKNLVNWTVGAFCFTTAGNAYVVAAVTTGVAGVLTPTGTGTGQVDGGVTWDYAGPYNVNRIAYLVLRNCVMLSSRDRSGAQVANGQFMLDSINDYGVLPASLRVAAYNNIAATPATYGITLNHTGILCAEFNVMAGADKMISDYAINNNFVQFTGGGGFLLSRKNIIQTPSTADAGFLSIQGDVISSFKAATVTPPNAVMTGPFTKVSVPMPWQYSLVQGPSVTAGQVRSDMRTKLSALEGVDAGYMSSMSMASPTMQSNFGLRLKFGF
jgi:hypothetical protein